MSNYRFTALLVPVALLAFLPAIAAYPFDLPIGDGLALPFVTLGTIIFCELRYPRLLPAPLVFASGFACDLFTGSPLGFWALLLLVALACARAASPLGQRFGKWLAWLCFGIALVVSVVAAWLLSSLYQLHWQDPWRMILGMGTALLLLPLPALVLFSFEALLIKKPQVDNRLRPFRSSVRQSR